MKTRHIAGSVKQGSRFAPETWSRCWIYWPTSPRDQRRQMITHRDALAQLFQARAVQTVAQFRLAHQNNLQQLAVVGLDVGKQAHLFQQIFGQVLRLVNDEHRFLAILESAGAEIR